MAYNSPVTDMSTDGPTETFLSLPRRAVVDETLSKSALRMLALMTDPMMGSLDPFWDTEHYAAALAVSTRTVLRAHRELVEKGWIGNETHRIVE